MSGPTPDAVARGGPFGPSPVYLVRPCEKRPARPPRQRSARLRRTDAVADVAVSVGRHEVAIDQRPAGRCLAKLGHPPGARHPWQAVAAVLALGELRRGQSDGAAPGGIATDDRPVAGAVDGDALRRVLRAHADGLFVDLGLAPRALVQRAPAAVLEALDEESWMSTMAWVTHHATCAFWPTWGKPGPPGTVSPTLSKRAPATWACKYITGISSSRCGSPIRIGWPVSVRYPETT